MWLSKFFKKEEATTQSLSWLHTDMHSHLLPGIDDGSPDTNTSIQLIKGFEDLGYKKIITTPHILWELYPNTTERIQSKVAELRQAIAEAGINMELHAAAEYFIDDHFATELKNKTPLLTISGNKVLVEFSMMAAPFDLQEILFEMQMQNYQPVLAHPERYTYLSRKKEMYDRLKDAGCLFQLNLLSLTGYYGEGVKQLADYLLKKDSYDFAGTDLHHQKHLHALKKLASSAELKRLKETGKMQNALL